MCATLPAAKKKTQTIPDSVSTEVGYTLYRSIHTAGADWDAAAPPDNIFLQRPYLAIVEAHPPEGMRFAYLVFHQGSTPTGVALCQIKYFKGDDNIADLAPTGKEPCFFNGLSLWFKKWVAGKAAADILICGNMLLTGEHGYWFDDQKISKLAAMDHLEKALDEVVDTFSKEGIKMPVILVKDMDEPQQKTQGTLLIDKGFTEFLIQPNMVLDLPYRDFDDYIGAMSTKYRTRAKRAFKKSEGIEKRELGRHDIENELPRIYELYKEVANNAGFNMVDLNQYYLLGLKKDLDECFRMFGYYMEGKLVAYYTTIKNHHEMEAHFLGYDKTLNHEFQLYLNCLYDMVKVGLSYQSHRIVFARTALEIKSSVGAEAHDLWCYLRHQNSFANRFAGRILEYLKPTEEWVPRRPFKEG